MAKAKQATTIANQVAFAALDLAVEMCTRPWIVELSRKSLSFAEAIVSKKWNGLTLPFSSVVDELNCWWLPQT